MKLLLRCPRCRQTMNYIPRDNEIAKKQKTCVYCGRVFGVFASIVRKQD